MLTDLPIEILQNIHDFLPADDRIRMRFALPKKISKEIQCKNRELELKSAILLHNIKRGYIKLETPILEMIVNEFYDDKPTIEDFVEFCPENNKDLRKVLKNFLSIYDIIKYGLFDESDIENIKQSKFDNIYIDALHHCKKKNVTLIFDVLFANFLEFRTHYKNSSLYQKLFMISTTSHKMI